MKKTASAETVSGDPAQYFFIRIENILETLTSTL